MPTRHRRRLKHYDDEGHAHFFTFSCWKRMPLLSKDRSRLWFLNSLTRSLKKYDYGCWAYVIMPEHVHLVVIPHPRVYKAGAFLSSLKLGVTHAAVKYLKQHNPKFLEKLLDAQPSGRKAREQRNTPRTSRARRLQSNQSNQSIWANLQSRRRPGDELGRER